MNVLNGIYLKVGFKTTDIRSSEVTYQHFTFLASSQLNVALTGPSSIPAALFLWKKIKRLTISSEK